MAITLYAIVGGVTYSLSDRNPFILLKEDGLGLAPTRRLTERGPQQHGESDLGYLLDPRILKYVFGFTADTETEYYEHRETLMSIFRPALDPISLLYVLPDGAERQIECHYLSDLTFSSDARYGPVIQKAGVMVRAPDPLFYDPDQQAEAFSLGGGSGGFVVPVVVPLGVGASTLDESRVINYPGTFDENPVITIIGPITDARIENTITGDALDFDGVTIAGGDSYVIDCRYGYKTVTNAAGTDKIGDLTEDSDLATFSLARHPTAPDGNNNFRVTGSGVTTATQVYIRYYHRYNGI